VGLHKPKFLNAIKKSDSTNNNLSLIKYFYELINARYKINCMEVILNNNDYRIISLIKKKPIKYKIRLN